MVDYFPDFNESLTAKASVNAALITGHRELPGVDYDHSPQEGCEACPAHDTLGGDHLTVGRHWCNEDQEENPTPVNNRYLADTLRQIQHMLHYLHWIGGHGWDNAVLENRYGNSVYSPFDQPLIFELVGSSGDTLTLKCNGVDPRDCVIFLINSQPSPTDPWVVTQGFGCCPQPGDFADVRGNSILFNRGQGKIIGVGFGAIHTPLQAADTFTITLDRTVHYASQKKDDADPDLPSCVIWRQAYEPERWTQPKDPYPLFCRPRESILEVADFPDGIIELPDADGNPVLAVFPIKDFEDGSKFTGTIKVLKSADGGSTYQDITSLMRDAHGYYSRRFFVDQQPGHYESWLYLGDTDWFGDPQPDLLAGATHVKIQYHYEFDSHMGTHAPCQDRCQWAARDYENVMAGSMLPTDQGAAVDGAGQHWFCSQRNNPLVTPENLAAFKPKCAQYGTCKAFQLRTVDHLNELMLYEITTAQAVSVVQVISGSPDPGNFIISRDTTPSITYLLTPEVAYRSRIGFDEYVAPRSGGYALYAGIITTPDANEHLITIQGALLNYIGNGGTAQLDWESNRWGNDALRSLHGIFYRRMADAFIPLTQDSEVGTPAGDDPCFQRQHERLLRKLPVTVRDAAGPGRDIVFTARDQIGIEGENRLQRAREFRKYIVKIDKAKILENQGRKGYETATIYPSLANEEEPTEVRVHCQFRANGKKTFGHKRIGGGGINGRLIFGPVHAGGVFQVHCYPGLWIASIPVTIVGGGSYESPYPFWASGNVVEFPDHYKPNSSHLNNFNAKLVGSLAHKAIAGDTIEFNFAPGKKFYITKAEPGAGQDFSDVRGDSWMAFGRVGQFFSFAGIEGLEKSTVRITQFETKWTAGVGGGGTIGTYGYWRGHDDPAVFETIDAERPLELDLDDADNLMRVGLLWDRTIITSGPVHGISNAQKVATAPYKWHFTTAQPHGVFVGDQIQVYNTTSVPPADGIHTVQTIIDANNFTTNRIAGAGAVSGFGGGYYIYGVGQTFISGSLRAYLTYQHYTFIAQESRLQSTAARWARIQWEMDGEAQTPKEIRIDYPLMQLSFTPDISRAAEWKVTFQNLAGDFEELTFAGSILNAFDTDPTNFPVRGWKYYAAGKQVMFHPNMAGRNVSIVYKTTSTVSLGDFPPAQILNEYAFVGDLAYLKKCDRLLVKDNSAGDLNAAFNSGAFAANAEFYIATDGVMKQT